MDYAILRDLHIGTILATLILFLLRGFWMMTDSPRLKDRWVRVVPSDPSAGENRSSSRSHGAGTG